MIRCLAFLLLAAAACAQLPNRWVYISRSLGNDRDVEDIRNIAKTASEHGLTGIMLSAGFDNLDRQTDSYRRRLAAVRGIADEYSLEIIPLFFSPGYAGGFLSHNRNLAEGLPVKNALFAVSGFEARLVPDPAVGITNNSFEQFNGHKVAGYQLQDRPGEISFVDTEIVHEGSASLRFENLANAAAGNARIMQEIAVRPYRCYRVTAWVRTENLQPTSAFRLQVLGMDGRALAPWDPLIPSSTPWRKLTFGFNSGDRDKIRLYAGTWGGRAGRFWIDDWQIEETGLLNVVRREGTPLTVQSDDGATLYEEGRDYARVTDPLLNFRFDHEPPPVRLLPDSRIKDGDLLRISYYHGLSINDGQVSACMSEPEMLEITERNVRLMHELLAPKKYMLSIDEIRAGGSCEACRRRGLTMGEILGDFVTRGFDIVRSVNPEAEVYSWSDMLDPNHNAHGNYYAVEGDYTGSWEHIPQDLNIVCWYFAKRRESLSHFSALGFRTVAGAYYDGDDLKNVEGWIEALAGTQGATGIMYTTWQNKYGLLADFGDLVQRPAENH